MDNYNDNYNGDDNAENNQNNGYSDRDDSNNGEYSYKDSFSNDSNYSYGNNHVDPINLRSSAYYSERYGKTSKKRNGSLFHIILVAVISSILGGSVVGAAFIFAAPVVQPAVKTYFGKFIPGLNNASSAVSDNGIYKKVEIEKSDSPVSAIAEKVGPSIVGIRVTVKQQNSFFSFGASQGTSEGSGMIIKSDGYIMTNYHVIESALDKRLGGKVEVILPKQKDKPYTAQIIGSDWRTDLAVLKIEASDLPAVEMGNSDELKVGELAVAIGNPAGLELMGSVTTGIISGLDRTIPLEDIKDLKLIQTDASINPGNSGGALVNSSGQVIGVNNAKMGGSGYEGLGFAIPINKAKEVTDSLMEFKYVKGRPLLGITPDTTFTEAIAKQYNVPAGVLVADVHPLSGAYKAGIKIGDIITKIDGKAIKNRTELDEIKNKYKPGETVSLEIYRDGQTKTLEVILSEDTGN